MNRELADCIQIQGLQLSTRIGVPAAERANPQLLLADLSCFPVVEFSRMTDSIEQTMDYDLASREIRALAASGERQLIESLADEIAVHLLARFPLRAVEVTLRKFILPHTTHVAVRTFRLKSID